MLDEQNITEPSSLCDDPVFRLSIYEAGHALTARAMGLKIVSVRMLPRPPVLVSDKTFAHNDWGAFIETLEIRVIELFGGQIAEETACKSNSCCSGDMTRIDELCRLISGLDGEVDHETVMFGLEDDARKIFAEEKYRDAILPIARFLHQKTTDGYSEVSGDDIETELDKYIPRPEPASWFKRTFGNG